MSILSEALRQRGDSTRLLCKAYRGGKGTFQAQHQRQPKPQRPVLVTTYHPEIHNLPTAIRNHNNQHLHHLTDNASNYNLHPPPPPHSLSRRNDRDIAETT
ncbi:hypothetical protein BaRGS_00000946 [Batillaria attramentaria]|uniref:Uncharacterized protein n=1 Tax=Batillaria attramentaria TaxID=370345 RepID=A0ABD0M9B5_9CAEN